MKRGILAFAGMVTLAAVPVAQAEDLAQIFTQVQQYAEKGNYPKAMAELQWAKKELEQQHVKRLQTFLPDDISGFKGAKLEANEALGFSVVSRQYSKANDGFELSLQGGSGGTGNGMGGLAALGQMAAMMGNQSGQSTFRIKGKTAVLNDEDGTLSLFLDGGTNITLTKRKGAPDLKAIAETINIEGLEKYLKGE